MSVWAGSEAFAEFKNYVTVDSGPEIIVHAVALHTGLEAWNGSAYIGNKLGILIRSRSKYEILVLG